MSALRSSAPKKTTTAPSADLGREDQMMYRNVQEALDKQLLGMKKVIDSGSMTRFEFQNFTWKCAKQLRKAINPESREYCRLVWKDCKDKLQSIVNWDHFHAEKFKSEVLNAKAYEQDLRGGLIRVQAHIKKLASGELVPGEKVEKSAANMNEEELHAALKSMGVSDDNETMASMAKIVRPDTNNEKEEDWNDNRGGKWSKGEKGKGRGKGRGKGEKNSDWNDYKDKWARMMSSKVQDTGRWDEEDSDQDENCPDVMKHGSCSYGRQCGFCEQGRKSYEA